MSQWNQEGTPTVNKSHQPPSSFNLPRLAATQRLSAKATNGRSKIPRSFNVSAFIPAHCLRIKQGIDNGFDELRAIKAKVIISLISPRDLSDPD